MLRGTVKRRRTVGEKPTLQNQITALARQVNRNKPETQYFRVRSNFTSSGTAVETLNINVTDSLISSSAFRDNITGDLWNNLRLNFRYSINEDPNQFRVVIYTPKKPGQRFTPSSYHFVDIPDPTAFTVWYDHSFSRNYDQINATGTAQPWATGSKVINLRNMLTKYNSDSAVIEKGEVMICLIYNPQTTSTLQGDYSFMLSYTNK